MKTMTGFTKSVVCLWLMLNNLNSPSLAAGCSDQGVPCETQGVIAEVTALRHELTNVRDELTMVRNELRGAREEIRTLVEKVSAIEKTTAAINLDQERLEIRVGEARFHFPRDGNMNVQFSTDAVCFAANDKSRPNNNDLKKCFIKRAN